MQEIFCSVASIAFFSMASLASEVIDLEASAQEFIEEVRQIEIPGYPGAFNPSLVRCNDEILLSFRYIPNPKASFVSLIGIVRLDEDLRIIDTPQVLTFALKQPWDTERMDDARLVEVGSRLYIVYSNNPEEKVTRGGFRVYIAEVIESEGRFYVQNIDRITSFPGESILRREKNWVPFAYDNELLLAYSLTPHRIFYPLWGEGACEMFCESYSTPPWPFGEMRGGTPALLHEGEYLSFFHSSVDMRSVHSFGENICHYFMGAYTFSSEPPFSLTKISPEPIVGRGFYTGPTYKPYWKKVKVVYPGGFIFQDKAIWIAYGRDDHECWLVKIDKEGLLQSLIPVK